MKKLKEIIKKYYYLLSIPLVFLSFPFSDFSILKNLSMFAWFCFVPLFLYIRDKNLKQIYSVIFVVSIFINFFIYGWIRVFGKSVPGGEIVVLLFLIPALSFFLSAKFVIGEFLSRKCEPLRMLIFPAVWIAVDYVQSIGFLAFPWAYLGYSQYQFTSFIQFSSYTGIFGITLILVFSNYMISDAIYFLNANKWQVKENLRSVVLKFIPHALFVCAVLGVIFFGWDTLKSKGEASKSDLKVSLVQSCISPWENWDQNKYAYLHDLETLSYESFAEKPEFLIWSESATLECISFDYFNNMVSGFDYNVLQIAKENHIPLLTGEIGRIYDENYGRYFPQNNAVFINEKGEVEKSYPKIHLCPFGEWFPYEKWFPQIKSLIVEMGGSSFIPGNKPEIFTVKGYKFGVLICYEGLFFKLNREYKRSGADFLVNITNDGWTDFYRGHMQHFSVAPFRAIENGLWFVRAGNTGYTTLIDPYGRITKSIPILQKGYLTGSLDFSLNHKTFYSEHGPVIIMLFEISVLLLFGIFLWFKRDKLA